MHLIFRKIQLVELLCDQIVERQTTFVTLKDNECNVTTIAQKVAESFNTADDEPYVLLDSRNQEIMDCRVTRGEYILYLQNLSVFCIEFIWWLLTLLVHLRYTLTASLQTS